MLRLLIVAFRVVAFRVVAFAPPGTVYGLFLGLWLWV